MNLATPSIRFLLLVMGLFCFGCDLSSPKVETHPTTSTTRASTTLLSTNPAGPELKVSDLHNVHALTPAIYCGSVPETDADFQALVSLGVKTVISVDGTKPHVDLAEKAGLRYVHLPFGYDGIPRERELEIVRAVRDLPGPVYIHCHHGLHRGPTAAVVAAESQAGWTPEQAAAALQAIGTSPQYPGLYASAKDFKKPTNAELDHANGSFPRLSKLDDLSDAMVAVDQHWDNLKDSRKAGWGVVVAHPDMEAATEASLLKELLREAHRPDGAARGRPADLVERLAAAETSVAELETALRAGDHVASDHAATALENACTSCHKLYRNPARGMGTAK